MRYTVTSTFWKHYIHYIFLSAIEFQEVGITLSTLQKCNILNWLKVVKESKSYPCLSCFRTWPFTYNAILIFLFSLLIWISCSSGEYLVERGGFFFFFWQWATSLSAYLSSPQSGITIWVHWIYTWQDTTNASVIERAFGFCWERWI